MNKSEIHENIKGKVRTVKIREIGKEPPVPCESKAELDADRQAEFIAEQIRKQLSGNSGKKKEENQKQAPPKELPKKSAETDQKETKKHEKKSPENKKTLPGIRVVKPSKETLTKSESPLKDSKPVEDSETKTPKPTTKREFRTPHEIWQSFVRVIRSDKQIRFLLIATLVLLSLILFIFLPWFRIQRMETAIPLYFNNFEDLVEKSGLREGQHFLKGYGGSLQGILTGRYMQAEEKILAAYAGIKDLKVKLHFPGVVSFEAEERIPIAFMQNGDRVVLLDREGIACDVSANIPHGLPVIRGIEVVSMTLGQPITSNSDDDLAQCVAVMSAIAEADFERQSENPLLPHIDEIRSSGYQRVVLKLYPEGQDKLLSVRCTSQRSLKDDFIWLSKVLESGVLHDKLPGTLDIYGKQLIYRPDKNTQKEVDEYVWQDETVVVADEVYEDEFAAEYVPEEAYADEFTAEEEVWQAPEEAVADEIP